jgi:hypothetical protein
MTEWAFLLTPLLVLPIVLLFRFVGCASFGAAESPAIKKRYRDYIMGVTGDPGTVRNPNVVPNVADVIAYWRLVEAIGSFVANDEKGRYAGTYELPDGKNFLQQPSLIPSDPSRSCRFYDGGYVRVPFKAGLYTDVFTIEAWVTLGNKPASQPRTLFSAGGRYRAPLDQVASNHHFSLVVGANNDWQVRFGPDNIDLFAGRSLVAPSISAKTHVALTVAPVAAGGGKRKVTLYHNGKFLDSADLAFYALPNDAPLLIGIGPIAPTASNPDVDPKPAPDLTSSMNSSIQEVVLHKKALSQEEIQNHVDLGT